MRKGESAGYKHFLLYPLCFQKTFFQGLKSLHCGKKFTLLDSMPRFNKLDKTIKTLKEKE